jgi:hypothetical protein
MRLRVQDRAENAFPFASSPDLAACVVTGRTLVLERWVQSLAPNWRPCEKGTIPRNRPRRQIRGRCGHFALSDWVTFEHPNRKWRVITIFQACPSPFVVSVALIIQLLPCGPTSDCLSSVSPSSLRSFTLDLSLHRRLSGEKRAYS